MDCIFCEHGTTQVGTTTVTLERDTLTLVIKGVPAQVCENCGEAYVDQAITEQLLAIVDQAAQAGVHVDVREYVAA